MLKIISAISKLLLTNEIYIYDYKNYIYIYAVHTMYYLYYCIVSIISHYNNYIIY